jgi:uncharacterized membrane protein YfcA
MEILQHAWWLVGATFFTSILTAVSGAGGGVLLLALCAMALPVGAVIPVHGVVQGCQNGWRLQMLWKYVDWPFVAMAAVGSVLGIVLIGPYAVKMPPVWGELLLASGLLYLVWAPKFKGDFSFPGKTIVMAMVVSMVTMVIGAAGTLFNAIRRRSGRDKEGVLADQSAIMLLQHGLKALVFGLYGFAFAPYLPLMVGMIGCAMLGTWVGVTCMKKMSNAWFDRVFKAVVTVLACKMIYDAVVLYWA